MPRKLTLWKVKKQYGKYCNIVIGKGLWKADVELFYGKTLNGKMTMDYDCPLLRYPAGTSMGRVLIDTGIMKSWSEVKGSHWKDWEIPRGFTDLYLSGAKLHDINKYPFVDRKPSRVTIIRLQ